MLVALDTFQILEYPVRRDGELLFAVFAGDPEVLFQVAAFLLFLFLFHRLVAAHYACNSRPLVLGESWTWPSCSDIFLDFYVVTGGPMLHATTFELVDGFLWRIRSNAHSQCNPVSFVGFSEVRRFKLGWI